MRMRGVIPRATQDVDVLAMVDDGGHVELPQLTWLRPLVLRVARDFAVPDDWLNTEVAMQWQTGLPPEPLRDVVWRSFGALEVGLAGRQLLVTLKLFAACDHSPASVHCQDLIALAPSAPELARAREWVVTQDASEAWPGIVDQVMAHVQAQRPS